MKTLGGTYDIEDIKIPHPKIHHKSILPCFLRCPERAWNASLENQRLDLKLLKIEDKIPSTGIKCWKPVPPGWIPTPGNALKLPEVIENFKKMTAKIIEMPLKKPIENAQNADKFAQQNKLKFSKLALDHYSSTTEGRKFELVEFLDWNAISNCGIWYHIYFTAKPIHVAADSTDPNTKYFFAELSFPFIGETSVFCCVVDPSLAGTLGSCEYCNYCNKKVLHPKDGFVVGN